MQHLKKIFNSVFNKIPFLKRFVKFILDILADILIFFSKLLGNLYTILFGFLGLSWYDHRYDQLRGIRNYYWLERAFFALPKISEGDSVLDIGCGDGIYSGVFYSQKAKEVLGVDKSQSAIEQAKKYYSINNVKFLKKDILTWNVPEGAFNVVTMFAVIEHFSVKEGLEVLRKIKRSLKKEGIFFGSTPIFSKLGIANWEHQNEFTSREHLQSFLKKVFKDVKISGSLWTDNRTECYFECRI
jgi:2-polyprenyl-3-methyl-5-hydroxy-6-metoxy-1,4-benzoquinol methylase